MFFRKTGVSWLAVFLGNPGAKYEKTRHNAGFAAASFLEKSKSLKINRLKFNALTCLCELGGEKTLLLKPQTFMNLSGDSVKQASDFYKIPPQRVIVVSDDVSLPPGKLRVRRSGSDGGQKGLRSISERLGSENYPRIKIGVGAPPHPDYDMADWVLSVPDAGDGKSIAAAAESAAVALEVYIADGPDAAMNKFN